MFRQRQAGFTLVELILVLSITAFFGALAGIAYPAMLASYRLSEGASQLSGAVREAQIRAVREGRMWRVAVYHDAGRDRDGYRLEYADTSGAASGRCGSAGWRLWKQEELPPTIAVFQETRSCVTYSPNGRLTFIGPLFMTDTSFSDWPVNGSSFLRLLDGQDMADTDPTSYSPLYDPGTATWDDNGGYIRLTLDAKENRYFERICLGLFTAQGVWGFGYPEHIIVKAAPYAAEPPEDIADWPVLIYDGDGPADPPDGSQQRTCFPVEVKRTAGYLSFWFQPRTTLVMDEVTATELFFDLKNDRDQTKRLSVNFVTGWVTVK